MAKIIRGIRIFQTTRCAVSVTSTHGSSHGQSADTVSRKLTEYCPHNNARKAERARRKRRHSVIITRRRVVGSAEAPLHTISYIALRVVHGCHLLIGQRYAIDSLVKVLDLGVGVDV